MKNESTVYVAISPCRGMEVLSKKEFFRRVASWREFMITSKRFSPSVVDAVIKTASNLIQPHWDSSLILRHMSSLAHDEFLHGEVRTECIAEIEREMGEMFTDYGI